MNDKQVPVLTEKYHKWLSKQMQGKAEVIQLMMRRTANTAIAVRCMVADFPFEELSKELFFFCNDIKAKDFTHLYEAQVELAAINEERFIKGLHKFYNETAIRIKKEDLYQEFFEFVSLSMRVRGQSVLESDFRKNNINGHKEDVMNAYQSLLMQQLEYLRPNKFDFSVVLCGRTTDGELMTVKDTLPTFDLPGYEVEEKLYQQKGVTANLLQEIVQAYRRHGFSNINSFEDIENYNQMDRMYTNHHCALCPYINEYTYDILPSPNNALSPRIVPLLAFQDEKIDIEEIIQKLKHRAKTLPTNGVEFYLESESRRNGGDPYARNIMQKVLLKELLYDDTIIMLYKVETFVGDISGYYDTKEGFFFSILLDASERNLYDSIRRLVLYLYACMVCRDGPELLQRVEKYHLFYYAAKPQIIPQMPIHVTPYGKGGKLLNMYHPERNESASSLTGKRAGSDKYESEQKAIQGFIRRVGAGKSPSPEAVARAESLGYELAPNETYVQPFIRRQLKLKKNTNI